MIELFFLKYKKMAENIENSELATKAKEKKQKN
jgi:hypothetical protein